MAALGIASSTNVRRCSCPIIEQATADGRAYLAILGRVWEASDARSTARGLRKRTAIRAHTAAAEEYRTIQTDTQHRWASTPQTPEEFEHWAVTVAQQATNADPRVTETQERADEARRAQQHLTSRQTQEHADLRDRVFGTRQAGSSAKARAFRWQEQAETAGRDLATIEALPVTEAARLVRARADQEQAQNAVTERALTERQSRAAQLHDFTHRPPDQGPTPSDRELGL